MIDLALEMASTPDLHQKSARQHFDLLGSPPSADPSHESLTGVPRGPQLKELEESVRDEVEDAVKFADESPKPVRPLGLQAARLLPESVPVPAADT